MRFLREGTGNDMAGFGSVMEGTGENHGCFGDNKHGRFRGL